MKRGEQAKLIKELQKEHGFPKGQPSKTIISRMVDKKDYRIFVTPKGLIDMGPTIKALLDSGFGERSKKVNATIGAKKADPQLGAKKESKKPTTSANKETEETAEDESQPLSMASTRARIEKHKAFQTAEKDRIKNETTLKTLVNFDDVSGKVFDFLRPLRDDIQDIAKRVSAIVYQTGSKREAEKVINDEINRILISRVGGDYKSDDDLKKKIIKTLTT